MIESMLIFLWSMLISMFSIPTIISVAHSKRILDEPDFRKAHKTMTPQLGGVAVFAGFVTGVAIFGQMTGGVQQMLAGCLIMFFVGVKDDINGVSVFKKFFVQVLAAGIVLFYADIRITSFQGLFGVYELETGISYAFTFLVILCVTNAVNLIDGVNGLAGTIVIIMCLTFGVIFYQFNELNYAFTAFALAGGMVGFLRYNMFEARVFMGDTGALVSGFIVSVMAIHLIEMQITPSTPALSIGILFVPLFDTLRVFIIRLFNGVSPFHPDRNHIHHYLNDMGLSHFMVVVVSAIMNLAVIYVMIKFGDVGNTMLLLTLGAFGLIVSLILELLHKKLRKV